MAPDRGRRRAPEEGDGPGEDGPGGEVTVLLVDDDETWARTNARVLERQRDGFAVTTATDLAGASEAYAGLDPDCVVCDYRLERGTGLDLLAEVREHDPDRPFVLVTGEGSEAVASDAIGRRVTDYVRKATVADRTDLLARRVEAAVRTYRTERALERERRSKDAMLDLVTATTSRRGLASDFCRHLVAERGYAAAWFGTYSPADGVVPLTAAGETAYPNGVVPPGTTLDDGDEPALVALAEERPCVVDSIDPDGEDAPGPAGGDPGGNGPAGGDPGGNGTAGDDQGGNGAAGDDPGGNGRTGDDQGGNGAAGDDPGGNGAAGDDPGGNGAAGDDPGGRGTAGVPGTPTAASEGVGPAAWRRVASASGLRSAAAVPVEHGGSVEGVLAVYGSEENAVGHSERELLVDYGTTIGFALRTAGWKQSLLSASPVTADIVVRDRSVPLVALCRALPTGTSLAVRTAIVREESRLLYVVRVPDASVEAVRSAARSIRGLELESVGVEATPRLYEFVVDGPTPESLLVDRGGRFVGTVVEGGSATVSVATSTHEAVPELEAALEDRYAGVSVVSLRSAADADVTSPLAELTSKQRGALELAFYDGYFERPRRNNGTEIAAKLGVTRATFTQHVRAAERKVLGRLLEPDDRIG